MNSVILVAFLIFTSTSRGGSTSYSHFTELDAGEFQNEFFEDEVPHTSNSEDSTRSPTEIESVQTDPTQPETSSREDQDKTEEKSSDRSTSEEIHTYPLEDPNPVLSAMNEVAFDKNFNYFLVHPFEYYNFKIPFHNEEIRPYLSQKRREIKDWKVSDDIFDSNNTPWNVDAYYPRQSQSEYVEESRYSENRTPEGPSVVVAGDYKNHNTQAKHPQYFQKNYYYNYYPLITDRKKWSSDDLFNSEETQKRLDTDIVRKFPGTNPCRQYLEFLKFAFERLDETSDYYYEPNDDYTEEWRERDMEKTQQVFGTHLLGPTFYVDNSGKISQINTNGNSIQVAEGISPDSRISIFSKSMTKSKPSTPEIKPTTQTPEYPTISNYFPKARSGFQLRTNIPEVSKKNETEPPTTTVPYTTRWETEKQPTTNIIWEQTTTEENDYGFPTSTISQEEYYGRMGRPIERKFFPETEPTTMYSPLPHWFSRTTYTTPIQTTVSIPTDNRIKVKTMLSFEDTIQDSRSDDADCRDKMLPCPDTVNITYPLNGYCNRYVSCESGRAIRRTCPDGLHFNLVIKSCDLPHNSFCTYVCPKPNGNFGIPGDCGGYFVCKNSNPEYRMCPPRMHWDINRSSCTFSQLSSCPMKCFRDNEVRPYEGDCKAYIVCLNGIPYYHKCPPNTKFDRMSLICVPDHISNCVDDPRLLTHTLNPSALCKDIQLQLNTNSWCRAFLPFNKQTS